MNIEFVGYSSDGYVWRCRNKGAYHEKSIRTGSWFSNANMTLEECIEITYWWSAGKISPGIASVIFL